MSNTKFDRANQKTANVRANLRHSAPEKHVDILQIPQKTIQLLPASDKKERNLNLRGSKIHGRGTTTKTELAPLGSPSWGSKMCQNSSKYL